MLRRFLRDEHGFIDPANYLFLVTIVAIGMIAGLTAIRDSVVQELGDISLGLENLDQTYTINCTIGTMVKQFGYDDDDAGNDIPGSPPAGISICRPPTTGNE